MSIRYALVCGLLVSLAGCVHAQKEEPRGVLIDTASLGLSTQRSTPLSEWWRTLADPQLDRLIDDSLAHNPTLDEALARVRASEAESRAAGALLKPSVALDIDETWQRLSENYYIPPPYGGGRYWIGTAGANLTWALDFWGKQAAALRQAQANEAAARLDTQSARLAVSGALTQAYLDLHTAYALGDLADRTLEQREELLKLTKQRFGAGLDTSIELNLAESRAAQASNAVKRAISARTLAVHRLAALTAHGPSFYSQIGRPQLSLDAALPIPESRPSHSIPRRPDVLAARARVDAADSGRVAARAAFYPDVGLKAFAGFQAIGLDTLFDSGSLIYGAGPALHLPIFDSKRLRAAYTHSTAQLDLAIASYNAVVLNAVREAADQLSLVETLAEQIGEARRRLAAAQTAYDMARQRYGAGLATQIVALTAETEVIAAEREVVTLEAGRTVARVNLLLTLGGSFHDGTG